MASINRRGTYWRAQVRRKGYPLQSRSFDTKAEAEAWVRSVEGEMDRGIFVSRGEAENTIRLELALVSHLFEIARKEWGMEGLPNPIKNIRKPSGSMPSSTAGKTSRCVSCLNRPSSIESRLMFKAGHRLASVLTHVGSRQRHWSTATDL